MTESLVSRADERDSHVFLGVQRAVHGVFSGDSTIVKPNVARSGSRHCFLDAKAARTRRWKTRRDCS